MLSQNNALLGEAKYASGVQLFCKNMVSFSVPASSTSSKFVAARNSLENMQAAATMLVQQAGSFTKRYRDKLS